MIASASALIHGGFSAFGSYHFGSRTFGISCTWIHEPTGKASFDFRSSPVRSRCTRPPSRDGIRCLHSPDIKAIRARRMLKDQLRAAHTTPPSHNGRQASSRRPCCHKESAVVSRPPDLAGRESTERYRRQLCVSENSFSAPPIVALLNQPACSQSCLATAFAALGVSVRVNPGRHGSRV